MSCQRGKWLAICALPVFGLVVSCGHSKDSGQATKTEIRKARDDTGSKPNATQSVQAKTFGQVITAIAGDIEGLKGSYAQLVDFDASKHVNLELLILDGAKTKKLGAALREILIKHGVTTKSAP